MTLSSEQRREFEQRGLVHLPGIVGQEVADALSRRLRAFLAERGLVPEAPEPGFTVTPSRTAPVANALGFEAVWGGRVRAALDDLLGAGGWHLPAHAGQLLAMTWPRQGAAWQLPHKMWHLDYTAPGSLRGLPGVQLFLCVDRVEPRGGGTLVATGTPRLVDAIRRRNGPTWPGRSADVRKALRAEVPWFSALCSLREGEDRVERFMTRATELGDGSLQVVELVGEPGDVWLMHPWMVHDASPNCGARPRAVLTERIRCGRPQLPAERSVEVSGGP